MRTYAVTLVWKDDRTETLEVAAGETVVEAARAAGVILPVGCTTGTCGTCAGLILEGADVDPEQGPEGIFEYRREPRAIGEEHRRRGYVLLCIAEPRSDCRVAVGAASSPGGFESPWS